MAPSVHGGSSFLAQLFATVAPVRPNPERPKVTIWMAHPMMPSTHSFEARALRALFFETRALILILWSRGAMRKLRNQAIGRRKSDQGSAGLVALGPNIFFETFGPNISFKTFGPSTSLEHWVQTLAMGVTSPSAEAVNRYSRQINDGSWSLSMRQSAIAPPSSLPWEVTTSAPGSLDPVQPT